MASNRFLSAVANFCLDMIILGFVCLLTKFLDEFCSFDILFCECLDEYLFRRLGFFVKLFHADRRRADWLEITSKLFYHLFLPFIIFQQRHIPTPIKSPSELSSKQKKSLSTQSSSTLSKLIHFYETFCNIDKFNLLDKWIIHVLIR